MSTTRLLAGFVAIQGSVCDSGATTISASMEIILFVARLASRVVSYVTFLLEAADGTHPTLPPHGNCSGLRGMHVTPGSPVYKELRGGRDALHAQLHGL